ncbi:trypsin domain-containing protein [Phthorimaea operculella]|nr:trypsin domain-containing protein [Phthorimaea operculella]
MMTFQNKPFVALVILVCFSFQSSLVSSGYRNKPIMRVYKGKDVSYKDYPFVMALIKMDTINPSHDARKRSQIITKRICTCSLIKPEWVLIAAHCLTHVKVYKKQSFKIVYGDLTIPSNTSKYHRDIKKAIPHFGFRANKIKSHMDGGILQMDPALLKDNIGLILIDPPLDDVEEGKISAVDYRALVGYPVTYLGVGGTYSFSDFFNAETGHRARTEKLDQSRSLQFGTAVIIKCKGNNPFNAILAGICVQAPCVNSHKSLIAADGGAPLLYKEKIVGIATMVYSGSEGQRQRYGALPPLYRKDIGVVGTAYTALSPYINWIHRIIEEESKGCNSGKRAKAALQKRKKDQPKEIQF